MSERSLFLAALEIDPTQRSAYLDRACGGDQQVRGRIEQLLQAHVQAGSFLDSVAPGLPSAMADAGAPPPGARIGPYKLLQPIGQGGMGTVYLAEQTEPVRRQVALKVIKAGMDSGQVVARFEAERQALALMDHPNIARVLDAGTTASGRPYFVMELVHGVPLTRYCDDQRLTLRQRLELFVSVCQAVQHAHQKGIIHRDLKPNNVLIALYDGKPVPKVIDFGLAKATAQKLTERTLFTRCGAVMGTLEYMSPEQAESGALGVDTRSDVYALGVLLYELLTGTTPLEHGRLKEASYEEVLRRIREEEPPPPSARLSGSEALAAISAARKTEPARLAKLLRGELDWVVLKCLEKERNRRYETASALARDVERYLADEPVQACPASVWYRFGKFARRHKRGLAMASVVAVALLLIVSTIAGSVGWVAAKRATVEQEAVEALDGASKGCERGQWPLARGEVARAATLLGSGGSPRLRLRLRQVQADVRTGTELEEIRLQKFDDTNGGYFGSARLPAAFAAAFRKYGLPVLELDTGEAAARIRTSALREALLAALDDWVSLQETSAVHRKKLVAVAQGADDDGWRRQCRAALRRDDGAALWRLARQPEALEQKPATLALLGGRLAVSDPEAAFPFLRQAQLRHPGELWLNFELALCLQRLGPTRVEEALGFLQAALALRPDSARLHVNLGSMLMKRGRLDGRLDEAAAAFTRAIHLKPDHAAAHTSLGNALYEQGRFKEAAAAHREAVRLWPDFAEAHTNLGTALKKMGQLDKAVAAHRRALRHRPTLAEAHDNLGVALTAQDRLDEAIAEHKKAIHLQPSALAYSNLAAALLKKGEVDAALDELEVALCLDPDAGKAHCNLGIALAEKGRLEEAVAAYKRASRLKPDHAPTYTNLGNTLFRQGKLDEALAAHERAIRCQPDAALPHSNRGNVLYHLERLDEALAAYKEALRLQPDLPHAHHGLGNALAGKGRVKEALAAYARAIHYEPEAPHSYLTAAEVLKGQGRLAEALDFQRRGHALLLGKKGVQGRHKHLASSHNSLAILLAALGQRDEAEKELRAALALGNKLAVEFPRVPAYRQNLAFSHNTFGWFLLGDPGRRNQAEGQFRAALALRKQLSEEFPRVSSYRHDLAQGHHNLGHWLAAGRRWGEAEAELRAALAIRRKLVEDFPHIRLFKVWLGATLCVLGHVGVESDRPKDALAWYGRALVVLSPLGQPPALGKAREFLGDSYKGRAHALEGLARHEEAARDWDHALELAPANKKSYFQRRLMISRAEAGQFEAALKDAERLARGNSPDFVYDCAAVYALAHARTKDDKHAARAVELLRRAIARGFRDAADLKKKPGFDSLRGRDDFKGILAELAQEK